MGTKAARQREVAFDDVPAPFGPGQPNLPDDQGLVSAHLKVVYANRPDLFTGLTLPPNSVVSSMPGLAPSLNSQKASLYF